MNEIFDNRDFYQTLVTPYDIEIALNITNNEIKNFTFDFNSISLDEDLNESKIAQSVGLNDVSLLTGKIRSAESEGISSSINDENAVALKPEGVVGINENYGAGYLSNRVWKGLEQNLGQSDVHLAGEGRKGIAQSYENEKDN